MASGEPASRERIIRDAFAALDPHVRQASLAQVGGFRPPSDPVTSWFGNRLVGRRGEDWPRRPEGPMLPLVQICTGELPYRHPRLDGVALLTVFVGPRKLPTDLPAANGDGWLARTYATADDLVPLVPPTDLRAAPRPFPIRWRMSTTEAADWTTARTLGGPAMEAFDEMEDAPDLFHNRYPTFAGTKVGGWPSYAQSPFVDDYDFVLQIGSEPKSGWGWGDNGYGHLHRDGTGEWSLYWDCY